MYRPIPCREEWQGARGVEPRGEIKRSVKKMSKLTEVFWESFAA